MPPIEPPIDVPYTYAEIRHGSLVSDMHFKSLKYAFDCTSRARFARSIRDDGHPIRDVAFLVPAAPIDWAPALSFWSRVADLPPVEFNHGFWVTWDGHDLPDTVVNAGPGQGSVFVVPQQQYAQLNEERDRLTELRQTIFNPLNSESPSAGAAPSQFQSKIDKHPFCFGRPRRSDFYPIPVCLLQPEFARFQDDLHSIPLDPSLTPLGMEFILELSQLFDNESQRELKLHALLSRLFGHGVSVQKRRLGAYVTGGGVVHVDLPELPTMPLNIEAKLESTAGGKDAVFEVILYYVEGVTAVTNRDEYAGGWRKTRLPSILIVHNGPNIQVFGALTLSQGLVEVLSHSIPLYFSPYNTRMMEDFLRFLAALRRLFESLFHLYQHPQDHEVSVDQVDFPYPHSYAANAPSGSTGEFEITPFVYIARISPIRLVFSARTTHGNNIIVKYGCGDYGVDAHRAAASKGLAPLLLSYSRLDGGMWMAVMQPLDVDFQPCDAFSSLPDACKNAIRSVVACLHALGYVHGDLRDNNVFVRQGQGGSAWECQLIDFDWAGRPGEVKYPLGVYNNAHVWRPLAHMDGASITVQDDQNTLEEFLGRRSKSPWV